jgi:hypothetical protein
MEELAEALVLDRATFSFPDLVATAALSPDGATLDDINRTVSSFLDSPLAIPLADSGRWTTAEILELERRSIDTARRRQRVGRRCRGADAHRRARCPPVPVGRAAAHGPPRLCSGNGVDLVVGAPGSGKTFALGAARLAWQAEATTSSAAPSPPEPPPASTPTAASPPTPSPSCSATSETVGSASPTER